MKDTPADLALRKRLREDLVGHFSLEELDSICFDLGVGAHEISGQTIDARARGLIDYLSRRGRLPELLQRVSELRPTDALLPSEASRKQVVAAIRKVGAKDIPQGGLPTGLGDIDRLSRGGILPSELLVIAARPGMGTTGLLTQIAHHYAVDLNLSVLLVSLQLPIRQIEDQLVRCAMTLEILRSGIDDAGWREHEREARESLASSSLHLLYPATFEWQALVNTCRHFLCERTKASLIAIDGCELLDLSNGNGGDTYPAFIRTMKLLAREFNSIVMLSFALGSRVNRRSDKRPMLSDVEADYGQIVQYSNKCILIYRDELYNPDTEFRNIAEVTLAQNMEGPTGKTLLYFFEGRFFNLKKEGTGR